MKLKKLIGMVMAMVLILMATLTIANNHTYAAAESYVLGLTNVRAKVNGGAYGIGSLKADGTPTKKVWKIVSYPKLGDYTISYDNAFYCMKAEYGFMLQEGNNDVTKVQKSYNLRYDMKSEKATVLKRLQAINVFKTDPTAYNKVMWIIDNMYLPKQSGQDKKVELLINAGIIDQASELQYARITDDDIEVVQQLAIWYFTNSDNTNYNSEQLPELLFNNNSNSDSGYNNFNALYPENSRGEYRQQECEMLYDYLLNGNQAKHITGAKGQGTYVSKDVTSPLTFDKSRVEVKEETGSYLVRTIPH